MLLEEISLSFIDCVSFILHLIRTYRTPNRGMHEDWRVMVRCKAGMSLLEGMASDFAVAILYLIVFNAASSSEGSRQLYLSQECQ